MNNSILFVEVGKVPIKLKESLAVDFYLDNITQINI